MNAYAAPLMKLTEQLIEPAQLALEVAALKAQVERLSAPVSIREYLKYGIWEGMKISVNALITARKEAGND